MRPFAKQVGIAMTIGMMVVLGGVIYGITTSPASGPTTQSTIRTDSVPGSCGGSADVMTINGTSFCAIDVSFYTVVQNPGYAYFRNGSMSYLGVKFQTICSPIYTGCPGSTSGNGSATVSARAIRFNMTFPDGTAETSGAAIGSQERLVVLSNHVNPQAGILVRYLAPNYQVYLLVSRAGG